MKLNTKSLKDIEIGFPTFAPGTYFVKRLSAQVEPNKHGTGNNLVIEVKLLDDKLITAKGEQLENKGNFKLTTWIGLVATDKYDPDTRIKELALAAGRDEKSEDDFGIEDIAEYMKVTLGVQSAGKDKSGVDRPESNSIKRFLPIKAEDNFTPPAI